jgi:predicted acyl esterase
MSTASRLIARVVRVRPPLTLDVDQEHDIRLPASDGVELLTDTYWPKGSQRLPTILIRTPYGRRGRTALVIVGVAQLFAERGYRVVVQSSALGGREKGLTARSEPRHRQR